MTDMSTQIFKIVQLDCFSIYCNQIDEETTVSRIEDDLDAILRAMDKLVARKDQRPSQLKYVGCNLQ